MRFLLCSVLAAGVALSACSSGGSQAVLGGGSTVAAPMDRHAGPHLVMTGVQKAQSCPSQYVACYEVNSPSSATFAWCISTSGNCSSGLLPGKWTWKDTTKVTDISTGKPTKNISSKWDPKVGNPTDNDIAVKSGVAGTGSGPGYQFTFEACGEYNSKPTCLSVTVGITVLEPCASPDPQQVGTCHLTVIQTIVEYFPQIKAATGLSSPPPEDQAAETFFQAAQQVAAIGSQTEALISQVASNYNAIQGVQIGPDCQNAEAQFNSGLQTAIGSKLDFKRVLSYLNDEENMYSSCAGFSFGVQSAIYIVQDGESTIYNPKWYKELGGSPSDLLEQRFLEDELTDGPESAYRAPRSPNGEPAPTPTPTSHPAKAVILDTVGGDVSGAVGGAVAGSFAGGVGAGPGALAGGAGGSAAGLVIGLWNWAWK